MDHHQLGMDRKWQRHYNETVQLVAVAMIILGVSIVIPVVVVWPQVLFPIMFNSRLIYQTTFDVEDYWNCNEDLGIFITYSPHEELDLITMYIYNVTNAPDVIQRGFKPHIYQMGPYGYRKSVHKYDITFHLDARLILTWI